PAWRHPGCATPAPLPPIRFHPPLFIANAVAEEYQYLRLRDLAIGEQSVRTANGKSIDRLECSAAGKPVVVEFDVSRFYADPGAVSRDASAVPTSTDQQSSGASDIMNVDWAVWRWWIAGGLLAATGLWVLYAALLRDRARGRRRCPRCWYDMAGVPGLRCPECGHAARRERSLNRARRRWALAPLGALCLGGGAGVAPLPPIRSKGWGLFPTTPLIDALAVCPGSVSLHRALDARLADPNFLVAYTGPPRDLDPHWLASKLSNHDWARLANRCGALLGSADQTTAIWASTAIGWSLP